MIICDRSQRLVIYRLFNSYSENIKINIFHAPKEKLRFPSKMNEHNECKVIRGNMTNFMNHEEENLRIYVNFINHNQFTEILLYK
jgi:hypothetical protein